MDIVVFTLFPQMFDGVMGESIIARSINRGLVHVEVVNFRDYTDDRHRTVDDYPFGGGAGMLLKPEPLFRSVEAHRREVEGERVILLSPSGRKFNQKTAEWLAKQRRLLLICGHYEGFDERIRQHLVTDELSLGDFVMTGGEIAAMAVVDAVVRLLPGALGNSVSPHDESFSSGLLEYPQYTRPASFRGMNVPAALLSGHHAQVDAWRHLHALYRTWALRPDLLAEMDLSEADKANLDRFERGDFHGIDVLETKRSSGAT